MKRLIAVFVVLFCAYGAQAQKAAKSPVRLITSTPLPGIEGDFDHFGVDVEGNRLFLTAEDHKSVEVFDLRSGKHLKSLSGFETPHSLVVLPEANKILVVDGGAGEVKIINRKTYAPEGAIKLNIDADSMTYDAQHKKMYVVNGGKDAKPKTDYTFISVIDTNSMTKEADIKVDNDHVEAVAVEKDGPRLFANITGKNQIGVFDREKKQLIATWSLPDAEQNVPMAIDDANHRLFIATRKPGKMIVFDTESGMPVADLPASGKADDMKFDATHKRIYVAAGEGFLNIYSQKDANNYEAIGKVPTGYRGKIATYVPELNRVYVAVSAQGKSPAKIMVFQAQP